MAGGAPGRVTGVAAAAAPVAVAVSVAVQVVVMVVVTPAAAAAVAAMIAVAAVAAVRAATAAAAAIRAAAVRVAGLMVVAVGLAGVGAVEGDAGRGQRDGDDLVDHPHVRVPGDHRFGDRVTRGRLGVLAGQVPRLAGLPAQPGYFLLGRFGMLAQLRERDVHRHVGVRAGPVRHHLRADQQLAALLQRVVEPLALSPGICRGGLLAERLQHRLHGRGAFRGEVAADDARAAERRAGLHVPVVEPVVIGVRPRGAPLLQRDAGDGPQVIQRGPA